MSKYLLFGVAVSATDKDSLHALIGRNDFDTFKSVVESKETPMTSNVINDLEYETMQTPLLKASLMGRWKFVEFLLSKTPMVEPLKGERDGYTPVHAAGFQGQSKVMELLLARPDLGFDKSDSHKDGFTPLHRACWGRTRRHARTVQILLKAGVSPTEKAAKGEICKNMTKNEWTLKVLEKFEANEELDVGSTLDDDKEQDAEEEDDDGILEL